MSKPYFRDAKPEMEIVQAEEPWESVSVCHGIGVELNESYAELCARRLQQLSLLA